MGLNWNRFRDGLRRAARKRAAALRLSALESILETGSAKDLLHRSLKKKIGWRLVAEKKLEIRRAVLQRGRENKKRVSRQE